MVMNLGLSGLGLPYRDPLQREVDHYGRFHSGKVGIEVNRAASAT
jgi:hypothetical protein